ncbi:hypothetical protein [Streptomyces sp. NPDC091268]|uniref:LIC_13387 family protein n=1 Tax=Streptomyces sp. NPDC091268 TaxID=3365979 RepID=UPI0037FF5764
MSATAPSDLRHAPGSLRPFKVGVGGFLLLGTAHLAFDAAAVWGEPTPQQEASAAALRASSVTLLGLERTTFEVVHGMSSAMALFVIACAVLALFAVRHSPALIERRTAFGWTLLAASAIGLAISALLLPPPPIIVLTVTSCAFALSLRRAAP